MKKIIIVTGMVLLLASCMTVQEYTTSPEKVSVVVNNLSDPLDVSSFLVGKLRESELDATLLSDYVPSVYSGSAYSISENLLVTNAHVVEDAGRLYLDTKEGRIEVETVYVDAVNDIALLTPVDDFAFPYSFRLGSSRDVELGTKVYAAGYPLSDYTGKAFTLTSGVVSAQCGLGGNPLYLQTSAPIQSGNSGGPLFDEDFLLLGMNTYSLDDKVLFEEDGSIPQNMNYALRSEIVEMVASRFLEGDTVASYVSSIEEVDKATFLVLNESNVEDDPLIWILTPEYSYHWTRSGYVIDDMFLFLSGAEGEEDHMEMYQIYAKDRQGQMEQVSRQALMLLESAFLGQWENGVANL